MKRELAKVFRLSEDRIQRILNDSAPKGRRTPTFSPESAIATVEKWSKQLADSEDPTLGPVQGQLEKLLGELRKLPPSNP